jgi:plasmid maintenance system antidote protein VapI
MNSNSGNSLLWYMIANSMRRKRLFGKASGTHSELRSLCRRAWNSGEAVGASAPTVISLRGKGVNVMIGSALIRLLAERKLSMRAAALKMGITPVYLGQVVSGECRMSANFAARLIATRISKEQARELWLAQADAEFNKAYISVWPSPSSGR